ncbi:MAG TPA: SapB/AmfS family lanthipeptide [Streptosporangiaceae bacterium]|nr:SapB/AmfS family lanthipeptide [Streptosporangiaceae bacterium]
MAILDLQAMDLKGCQGGAGSDLSVLLCDSVASVTLCL